MWVVAAEIEVVPGIAKVADYRGSFRTTEGQRIEALEVYCEGCCRPYDELAGKDCAAKIDNRHLIGGDQSTRAKRKIPAPPKNARVVAGGCIQRRGMRHCRLRRLRPPTQTGPGRGAPGRRPERPAPVREEAAGGGSTPAGGRRLRRRRSR
ncbi:hypothetical protein K701_30040 [Streptomyces fradiae ATCC 10745 = DSM 40063]|uniref:Uncharacterized protein n=1 Tax=Streptomyces fradiae ATCC 10745 = DSM 40063 TaxID=1319510 RepID=A0A1Y2P0L3_STRFR|nr:hypothetical protein K701_30040 [Streptomyces fradiae ATCC 10745 = DSM 40063]OSY53326.1 hypothetical protein BG846_00997 [Streptomyces fradiae ATCC 10745 = DSM 40063]